MSIRINPAHKGEFRREEGARAGHDIPMSKEKRTIEHAKAAHNVELERQAVFAENARRWNR